MGTVKIVIVYHKKIYKMKLYSYFDGKTQFSQIFLGCIFFVGVGMGGGVDKSPRLSPVS